MTRFPGEAKSEVLDIAKSAVNEFGATSARRRGEVLRFDECHSHSAKCSVAKDRRACNSSADDQEVKLFLRQFAEDRRTRTFVECMQTHLRSLCFFVASRQEHG